jgi:hypothetical protein
MRFPVLVLGTVVALAAGDDDDDADESAKTAMAIEISGFVIAALILSYFAVGVFRRGRGGCNLQVPEVTSVTVEDETGDVESVPHSVPARLPSKTERDAIALRAGSKL